MKPRSGSGENGVTARWLQMKASRKPPSPAAVTPDVLVTVVVTVMNGSLPLAVYWVITGRLLGGIGSKPSSPPLTVTVAEPMPVEAAIVSYRMKLLVLSPPTVNICPS